MDLHRLADAFRAHKLVAAVGLGLAILLAFLAFVRVNPGGDPVFEYRRATVWSSEVTIQLTQEGFPEGRVQDAGERRAALIALAPLYARLATTDPVRRRMRRAGPVLAGARVDPVVDEHESALPMIKVSSFALTKSAAITRAQRQASAFIRFIASQQAANDVAPANRVVLRVLKGPTKPRVVVPRKKTLPVVVFCAMLVIMTGVVLVLENLRRAREGAVSHPVEGAPRKATERFGDAPRKAPVAPEPKPDGRPTPVAGPALASTRTVASPPARRTLGAERSTNLRTTADSDGAGDDEPADELATGKRRSRASRGRSR